MFIIFVVYAHNNVNYVHDVHGHVEPGCRGRTGGNGIFQYLLRGCSKKSGHQDYSPVYPMTSERPRCVSAFRWSPDIKSSRKIFVRRIPEDRKTDSVFISSE